MPKMDYSKLLGRMKEKGYTQERLADSLGLSRTSINNKLSNKTPFTAEDIRQIVSLLDISPSKIGAYFFTE